MRNPRTAGTCHPVAASLNIVQYPGTLGREEVFSKGGRDHAHGAANGMESFLDPRNGDIENDASSTKARSMRSIAGTLLAEISLAKMLFAWTSLVLLPALSIGVMPIAVAFGANLLALKFSSLHFGISSVLLLSIAVVSVALGGRRLFRIAERNFWTLNSIVIQPAYTVCREVLSQGLELLLSHGVSPERRARWRSASSITSGLAISGFSGAVVWLLWPHVHATFDFINLWSLPDLARVAGANAIAILAAYVTVAALTWSFADATLPPALPSAGHGHATVEGYSWRVAHLSDIHVVGERFGFRIESGRLGPRGNDRLVRIFKRLSEIHAADPLDVLLITGDITDAGLSTEWAEFLEALGHFPELLNRTFIIPGNHDLNIVDRVNPARIDLPTSLSKTLRKVRLLSTLHVVQGKRVRTIDREARRVGASLAEVIRGHAERLAAFSATGRRRHLKGFEELWADIFPMVVPPEHQNGVGIILLNSNAETHFSFTNALGLISADQFRGVEIALAAYPEACWLVAMHHHPVEYPTVASALSERIGTVLINGNWFLRKLQPFSGRVLIMHGHRHIDWQGTCGDLSVISAPSAIMEATDERPTHFYIHTLTAEPAGRLSRPASERIDIAGEEPRYC